LRNIVVVVVVIVEQMRQVTEKNASDLSINRSLF